MGDISNVHYLRELLAKIADFEQQELSSGAGTFHKHRKLDPINTTGGEKLLQMVRDGEISMVFNLYKSC